MSRRSGVPRVAKFYAAGSRYHSYVKMLLIVKGPTVFLGDMSIPQNYDILRMASEMRFGQSPHLISNRFSSPIEGVHHSKSASAPTTR